MIDKIQLIIPMSGIGRRFLEAGYEVPKPLIEVDGKPMIEHVINLFPGIKNISFICNEKHLSETNMREVLKRICPNGKILEASNADRKGPVYAISKVFDYIDDNSPVIVSYCDYGTSWNFSEFLNFIKDKNLDGAIACYRGFHPHMLGSDNYAFCKEENHILLAIKEKEPFTENKMNEFASNGTYFFGSGALLKQHFSNLIEKNISINNEFYVSMSYNSIVDSGYKVGIFEIDKMLQWGTPHDLEIYKNWSKYFRNKKKNMAKNPTTGKNITLILPMAGRGERFSIEGFNLPKPLLTIDNEPMVINAVKCLPQTTKKVFIALKEHSEKFKLKELLENEFVDIEVITIDDVTKGQACTCEIGISKSSLGLDDSILISACDNGVVYDEDKYKNLINDETIDIIVWSFRNNPTSKNNPNMYSWMEVDSDGYIHSVSCKKFNGKEPLKTHAIIGTMFFRKAKFFIDGLYKNYKHNKMTNGEYYVDDVINQCINMNLKVKVFEVENYICWGTPNDYRVYNYWKEYFESPEQNNEHIQLDKKFLI